VNDIHNKAEGVQQAVAIEVVTPDTSTTTEKGNLLESFAARFLRAQNFEVESQLRVTASELDLLCRHRVDGRTVYVECKAHRGNLGAEVLKSLLGTVEFHGYEEGWLVTTGPLGKDARGFKDEWEQRPPSNRKKLSIYTAERVIQSFVSANVIKQCPPNPSRDLDIPDLKIGDWLLMISPYGTFWVAPVLTGGVASATVVYDAQSMEIIRDTELLKRLAATDSSFRNLDFECLSGLERRKIPSGSIAAAIDKIVEVDHGESWTDYRPARPKDFVGRHAQQETLHQFLEAVRLGRTATRVFAVTGDSGMGKSSLIAKIRDRARNSRNRTKFFIYALDARSARTPAYILGALVGCLREATKKGFGAQSPEEIVVSDYADPLASDSIQQFLHNLHKQQQVVCLIFDQFEELYAKSELSEIFEEA